MARVLIIDDNETMREGLGATVRRMGHEAIVAPSGDDGLKQCAAGRGAIDFVITDLKMEGKGGLEVVKAVAERDPDCPVMIATAFGTVETAVEAMRMGAFDFIQKPFAPEVVSVPTRGMERWLAQRLSASLGATHGRKDGVCANVDFPPPRRLLGDAVAVASHIPPDEDPWRPERAVWPLL